MHKAISVFQPDTGKTYIFTDDGPEHTALARLRRRLALGKCPNKALEHDAKLRPQLPLLMRVVGHFESEADAEAFVKEQVKVRCLADEGNYHHPSCFEAPPARGAGPAFRKKHAELEAAHVAAVERIGELEKLLDEARAASKGLDLPLLMVNPETGNVVAAWMNPALAADAIGRSANKLSAAVESGEVYADHVWKVVHG